MEDAKAQTSSNELEVVQMLGIDTRCGIDLERVVVMRRILEQAIERVEHLMR